MDDIALLLIASNLVGLVMLTWFRTSQVKSTGAPSPMVSSNLEGFLPLVGGTMKGSIDMGTNSITMNNFPNSGNQLTNKTYVDTKFLPLEGGLMKGPITMGSNKLTITIPPSFDTDVANKAYVDAQTLDIKTYVASNQPVLNFLPLDGGTMNGAINMGSNPIILTSPTQDAHSANKAYVDSKIADEITEIKTYTDSQISNAVMGNQPTLNFLPLDGGTMKGTIDMGSNPIILTSPTQDAHSANKAYVDSKIADEISNAVMGNQPTLNFLPLDGGMMKGTIDMGSNPIILTSPTQDAHSANKAYVDDEIKELEAYVANAQEANKTYFLPLDGGTMNGTIDMGSNPITLTSPPTQDAHSANKAYVDSKIVEIKTYTDSQISNAVGTLNFLPLDGGTMSGTIDMGSNPIILTSPTQDAHSANKAYVDAYVENAQELNKTYFLSLDGGTMKGTIDMGSNPITLTSPPTQDAHSANKAYVDQSSNQTLEYVEENYLPSNSNVLISKPYTFGLETEPTLNTDITNKLYVDILTKVSSELYNDLKRTTEGLYTPAMKWILMLVEPTSVTNGYKEGVLTVTTNNGFTYTSSEVTIPDDGLYGINWGVNFQTQTAAAYKFASITINGKEPDGARRPSNYQYILANIAFEASGHEYFALKKDDKVKFRFYNSNGTVNVSGGRLSVVKLASTP